jgi:D-glycero-alpha-D-manno-heptose-7-phosphate kinase
MRKVKERVQLLKGEWITARAPLRLGFAGGGTDLSPFCDEHTGYVMNATIALFAYAYLSENTNGKICFEASELDCKWLGKAESLVPICKGTELHAGVYNRIVRDFNYGHPLPVNLRTTVDVPSGSGLGGSSALVVALIEAFREYLQLPLGDYDVARLAFDIERNDLSIAGGKQDHYASAFGGFNFMEFYGQGKVVINPLRVTQFVVHELEASMLLYFTGVSRDSSRIIEAQQKQISLGAASTYDAMHALKREAVEMKEALLQGRFDDIADTMLRGWQAKKSTASEVSNAEIDRIIELVMTNGARSGKISGAGGGGFIFILCDPVARHGVRRLLEKESGRVLTTVFTSSGAIAWRQVT